MQDSTPLTPVQALSALADDQALAPHDMDRLLAACTHDPKLMQAWRDVHWMGECLRSGEQSLPPASTAFAAGVMERLSRDTPHGLALPSLAATQPRPAVAANSDVFRWKLVAGVSTLAAAITWVWHMGPGSPELSAASELASVQAVPVQSAPARVTAVVTERGVLLRDPQLDALLAAHRQQGGVSALQMPAGFLRDATYESKVR